MFRTSRGVVGMVAAVLTATVLSAQPAAAVSDPEQHGRPARYLALGDSVAFGFRPSAVTPATDYLDASNFRGYPEVLGRRLGLRVANASCPGETTGSMIDVTAPSYGCTNSPVSPGGYRSVYPLHRQYAGAQLDYAVHYLRHHPRTRLISIDIGANDLFLCQDTTPDQCTGPELATTVATVRTNLDTILGDLRQRAHYRHRLVVLTYYSLDYGDPVGTAATEGLNDAMEQVARGHRARVADGFRAFRRASGGTPCAAELLIALPTGGCDKHPSARGHRVLARAVARAARG